MSTTNPASEFGITRYVIGSVPWMPLTDREYSDLSSARHSLVLLLTNEENLESLIECFIELESALLGIAVRHSVQVRIGDLDQFSNERLLVNRRVTSLLAMARQYLDQMAGIVKRLLPQQEELAGALLQNYSVEYDRRLNYRLCEALRNYALHAGHPVTNVIYQASWEDLTSGRKMKGGLSPQLQLEQLLNANLLKKPVRDEVQVLCSKGAKTLDLMPVMRDYISGIGQAHEACRNALKEHVSEMDRMVENALVRYEALDKSGGPGVCLQERSISTKERVQHAFLGRRLTEARKSYEERNALLGNMQSRYVTSA